jgi:hypothetical protein
MDDKNKYIEEAKQNANLFNSQTQICTANSC